MSTSLQTILDGCSEQSSCPRFPVLNSVQVFMADGRSSRLAAFPYIDSPVLLSRLLLRGIRYALPGT